MARRFVFAIAAAWYAPGCASDDAWSPSCVEACERLEAAACPKAPAYGATCDELCDAARARAPEQCLDEVEAVYACYVRDVSFECRADGNVTQVPSDACRNETRACSECTHGDVLVCVGG